MDELTAVAAPAVEGVPAITGLKDSELTAKAAEQSQETVPSQVETGEQRKSSEAIERARPSEFYKIRKLEKTIRDMQKNMSDWIAQKSSVAAVTENKPVVSREEREKQFWSKLGPDYLEEREMSIREEIDKKVEEILEKKVPKILSETEKNREYDRKTQEALEIIFPKTNPDSKDTWEQRSELNRDRTEKIIQIMNEYGLNFIAQDDPVLAAKRTLELYELFTKGKQEKKNPMAPTKGQMGSTNSGSPIGGGKKMPTANELLAKHGELMNQITQNPELRHDEKFMQQWQLVKSELEKGNRED